MQLDLQKLGENVKNLRTARGWSLADFAENAELSKAYLSDLENGKGGRPNVQYLLQVATALDTTIERLLGAAPSPLNTEVLPLPAGLRELAEEEKLSESDVEVLAQLHFRGGRPRDVNGWKAVYQVLKAVSKTSKD